MAGTAFSFDIAALKTDRILESAYVATGAIARHVKLELFDDTGFACGDYTNPVATQTASFASALLSIVPGRALSGAFTVDNVHRSLLVRIKECTDSTCTSFTSTLPACSSDRFSVRPSALTLSTTTSMPSALAPDATASQTIRAGANFTLFAKTSPASGYASVLTLDASKLTAQSPDKDTSMQNGGTVGVLTPTMLPTNTAEAIAASYSEAGYLYISAGAYRDDDFTNVDRRAGDCIISTVNDDYLADTLIDGKDGKYGCSIGNKLSLRMGRFIPDHFSTEIVSGAVMPCPVTLIAAGVKCPRGINSGFIYSGQPFAMTVTARNLANTITLNYRSLLAHDVMLEAWSTEGGLVAAGPTGSVLGYSSAPVVAAAFALGVASANVIYTFPTSYSTLHPETKLAAPTDIYLRAVEIAGDGVTSMRDVASSSIEAGVKVVSGRLHVANNYGSELLTVPVVVHAQYWSGARFVNSTTDQKTSFGRLDVRRTNCKKKIASKCMELSIMAPKSPLMVNGAIRLTMAAPGAGNNGSVDLNINGFDWLPSTTARIGMGVYKAGPVIYMREAY
jgi:MSHA biogenesis protein MshQ